MSARAVEASGDSRALRDAAWPLARAADALESLAHAAHLPLQPRSEANPQPPPELAEQAELRAEWLERLAEWFGLQAVSVEVTYPDLPELIRGAAPALLAIELDGAPQLLALLRSGRTHAWLLDGAQRVRRLPAAALQAELAAPVRVPKQAELGALLDAAGVAPARRARALEALLREQLARTPIGGCWLLQPAPHGSLGWELRRALSPGRTALLIGAQLAQYALLVLSWEAAVRGALAGSVNRGWLIAWLLALLSMTPFLGLTQWLTARFLVDAGALLRARLLAGILRLPPEQIQREGSGQLLGRVIEAGALQSLGLGAGIAALLGIADLGVAFALFARSAAGGALCAALCALLAVCALLAALYWRRLGEWTARRLELTLDLVERMVGQRTLVAQSRPERWHEREDGMLERYLASSARLDRALLAQGTLPRLWMALAFACMMSALWTGEASPLELGLALGGVLIALRAAVGLSSGAARLAGAAIAWRQAAPLLRAPPLDAAPPDPGLAVGLQRRRAGAALEAHDLTLHAGGRAQPLLACAQLRIEPGDRILLQGASGSGKSTLAHALAGLRHTPHGLLLLGGLDRATLGASGWRRAVTLAPQFHENHVLGESFAFNALLGCRRPLERRELERAEALCRDLGLRELLDRMPAGILQQIGETGWQLSHGERSRLFAARALLSDADLVILDESTASLDPASTEQVLRCARKHARALLVIAHP